jgi:putative transcriptional regulator
VRTAAVTPKGYRLKQFHDAFARCLNVTTSYVSQIERGAKRPRGATLKLLSIVRAKGLEAIL